MPITYLLEDAARSSLLLNPATRGVRLYIRAKGMDVVVTGIVDDDGQREAVLRTLARALPGVGITCSLRAPTDFRCRSSSI
jgi:hypothetical protein